MPHTSTAKKIEHLSELAFPAAGMLIAAAGGGLLVWHELAHLAPVVVAEVCLVGCAVLARAFWRAL